MSTLCLTLCTKLKYIIFHLEGSQSAVLFVIETAYSPLKFSCHQEKINIS